MFLKRKRRAKLKAKGCAEGRYHQIFNHKMESSSDLIQSNTHKGCRMLNIMDYYKLRNVLEYEDDSTINKWTWFNKKVCDIFLCSCIISQALVDYTDMGRAIGCILDDVYALSVSKRDSIGSTTSFSIHQWYYTQDPMIIYVYVNLYMKASYLHHQINNIMEKFHWIIPFSKLITSWQLICWWNLYIAARYFCINNWYISGKISRAINTPTKTVKSDYFIKTIQGELFDINKLDLNKINSTKSIVSKRVRL